MELALKTIGILASLLALYKVIIELLAIRSSKRRDEYDVSKNFISDLENPAVHRLTLEKGFLALTGKIYPIEEIRLLLSSNDPSFSINERSDAKGFVVFCQDKNNYSWKGLYSRAFVRKNATKWYYSWYAISAFLGITPIYVKGMSALGELPILAFSGSLILISIMCLSSAENYKKAERFMSKFGETPNQQGVA